MRARFVSTVFGLMNSAAATSRVVMPDAASSATRCSDGRQPQSFAGRDAWCGRVRRGRGRPTAVCPRPRRPASASLKRRARGILLALATLQLAQQQQGAGAFERHRKPVVVSQRPLRHAGRLPRRHRARPAACCGTAHRRPASTAGPASRRWLQRLDHRLGLVEWRPSEIIASTASGT